MPVINSLLQTDLYKFSMMQIALHQFAGTHVEYAFKCRNAATFTPRMLERIKEEIAHFCSLRFTKEELEYLKTIRYFKASFIDFLRLYQPDSSHVTRLELKDGVLDIRVAGPWFLTILFEVPVLAIVNQVYFEDKITEDHYIDGMDLLESKINFVQNYPFPFSDFGTRRRASVEWHDTVIMKLAKELPNLFKATSNVYYAKKYNLTPVGTMAHEYLQIGQAAGPRLIDSQKFMLQKWVDEYRGDLGYALTDVVGVDAFLRDFDLYFAKLYDGVRHDSGNPFEWAEKMIAHYEKLKIDPKTKTLVFSDSLTMEKAHRLWTTFGNRAKLTFGIGTHLTNDIPGLTPLNIVMKVVNCNGQPVAKISDSPGKGMCEDEGYVNYLKQVFQIKG